ncbi:TonB-dependent receptor [Maricurvus nonylphenolicus]
MYKSTLEVEKYKSRFSVMASTAVLAAVLTPVTEHVSAADFMIEEVVVTATKREQSIQDIPASVSQVSGSDLEARGIGDIENLSAQIPNLQFGKLGDTAFITIRGIGTTVDSGVAEPAVASYVDGVFLPRATMSALRQVDLDRVEVLRGPQGTLYGRNATGGSISFVSRAPTEEFEAGIRVGLKDRDGYAVSGFASGPLSDKVLYRVSLGQESQDGYVDVVNTGQDIVETDVKYGRVALQINPSDELMIDLSAQHEASDAAVGLQQLLSPAVLVDFFAPGNNQTLKPNKTYGDGDFSGDAETTIVSARVNWDISDSVSLRSVTGYVDHDIVASFDADATDAFYSDLIDSARSSESFSQEFNLYGETEKLSWLLGAYYFQETFSLVLPVDLLLAGSVIAGDLKEETESYAFFTDLTYSLTDRLRVNAGLRYNVEEKEFEFFGVNDSEFETDDLLPKLGLQYDLTNDINIYAHWQQGIKSGGHQLSSSDLFKGEELDAYEVGVKSQAMDGRLTVNAAAFYYDYTDLQATATIPPATTLVENADAEVMGAELEVVYNLNEALSFNVGLSFLDSEYSDFTYNDLYSSQTLDLEGEELIRAPAYTASVGAEWVIPVDGDVLDDIRLRAEIYHSDDYKLAFVDYDETHQSSYTTANASIVFNGVSEQFQVRAYVNNITDELYLNNGSYLASLGGFIGQYSEPRTYGVSLAYNF